MADLRDRYLEWFNFLAAGYCAGAELFMLKRRGPSIVAFRDARGKLYKYGDDYLTDPPTPFKKKKE